MNTSTHYAAEASHIYFRNDIRSFLSIHPESVEQGINHEAFSQMEESHLPDLRDFCLTLAGIMRGVRAPKSARDLLPFLGTLPVINEKAVSNLLKLTATRFVLITGERFEVVLNHWKPGKASDIHFHSSGGCIFKLLYGKVEEVRYTPDQSQKFMGFASYRSGDLGNINNETACHQVGNPYGRSAVSIHIYLKDSI